MASLLKQLQLRTRSALAFGGWILCLCAVLHTPGRADETEPTLEYRTKAAYLVNFLKFVEWPTNAVPSDSTPLIVGVMDRGEAFPIIQKELEGKSAGNHPVSVRSLRTLHGSITNCHLLFVTRAAGKTAEILQTELGQHPTLLVGETENFAEHGGAIGFVVEADNIRLTLNLEAATAAGLKVNSKLASVARLVKSKPGPEADGHAP
jgi:hypothetical protein